MAQRSHYVVYLPPPELFDEDEVYAVRCVRLYDADISKLAMNFSARWYDRTTQQMVHLSMAQF
jgi:hypothetical protein